MGGKAVRSSGVRGRARALRPPGWQSGAPPAPGGLGLGEVLLGARPGPRPAPARSPDALQVMAWVFCSLPVTLTGGQKPALSHPRPPTLEPGPGPRLPQDLGPQR